MNSNPYAGFPPSSAEAVARITSVTRPTLDDMKLMVLVEASGHSLYAGLAGVPCPEPVRAAFLKNAQEELAHAHRVSRAIKRLFDVEFPVPDDAENPYGASPAPPAITRAVLERIATAEAQGDALYGAWADSVTDAEVAKWFRQNGREEMGHGERLRAVLHHLPA